MWSWIGIAAAGLLNGSFAVPMKTARAWKFHQIWGVFSVLAMGVIPWAGVVLAVKGWQATLGRIPLGGWLGLIAIGLLWGVASLLYGVAVDLLGIALGFSIQLGLSIVIGALVPLVGLKGLALEGVDAAVFFGGLTLMVVGVVLCAQAGGGGNATPAAGARFRKGLIIAILGGLGAPLLNVGIVYGISLIQQAGAASKGSLDQWIAWAVFLTAASATQAGYCFYRVAAGRPWRVFRAEGSGHDAFWVLVMSIVWAASVFLYGSSASSLGGLGASVGWPVFVGLIVLTSNGWGVILGEWKGRSRAAFSRMVAGSAVLILAAFLIGRARTG